MLRLEVKSKAVNAEATAQHRTIKASSLGSWNCSGRRIRIRYWRFHTALSQGQNGMAHSIQIRTVHICCCLGRDRHYYALIWRSWGCSCIVGGMEEIVSSDYFFVRVYFGAVRQLWNRFFARVSDGWHRPPSPLLPRTQNKFVKRNGNGKRGYKGRMKEVGRMYTAIGSFLRKARNEWHSHSKVNICPKEYSEIWMRSPQMTRNTTN